MNDGLETFSYDDAIVRKFLIATFVWGLVGMSVGLLIGLQMAVPALNLGLPWTSFGRLRPAPRPFLRKRLGPRTSPIMSTRWAG